jgi:hypothetical protein
MPTRIWLRLAEVAITAILALALVEAWHAERRDRAALAVEPATAKQALAAADSRQHDRDTQLLQTLSAIAAKKRAVTSPAQIVHDLPQQIGVTRANHPADASSGVISIAVVFSAAVKGQLDKLRRHGLSR